MKTAEATLQSSLDEKKARAIALESESQELRRGLKAKEQEGDKLGSRLEEAVENIASLKKEAAETTAKEEVRFNRLRVCNRDGWVAVQAAYSYAGK